jgi:hypothetical protein
MAEALKSLPTYTEIALSMNPAETGDERIKARIDYEAFGAEYALRNYFTEKTFNSSVREAIDAGVTYDQYYNAYFTIKDLQESLKNVYSKDKYGKNDKLLVDNNDKRKQAIMRYINSNFSGKKRDAITSIIADYSTNDTGSAPARKSTQSLPQRKAPDTSPPKFVGIK